MYSSSVEGDNERRRIRSASAEETRFVEGDKESDDGERTNIDDSLSRTQLVKSNFRAECSRTTRQNVPLTAAGMVLRGFGVSEAAKPTSSVPATFLRQRRNLRQ
jgi:hypothetical protein